MSRPNSDELGRELRQRREDLGLTQEDVATAVGITTRTIQQAEHGRTTIRLGKRETWERVLRLQPGAISRAYRDGTPLAVAEETAPEEPGELDQRPGEDNVAYAHRLLETAMGVLRKQRGA